MTKASDNVFPKVIVLEGTAPSSPSAGNQTLYIDSADHKLKRKNSSGTVTIVEAAAGAISGDTLWDAKGDLAAGTGADTAAKLTVGANGTVLRADSAQSTGLRWANILVPTLARLGSGDVTITATTNVYASNVTGLSDLTVAAASGDTIMVGLSARCANTTAAAMKFDVCTVVSAAAVNFLSNATGTGATNGVSAWLIASGESNVASGTIPYVVQSGDISGGNVTLRLTCFVSANRVLSATTATNPLMWFAYNMGQ